MRLGKVTAINRIMSDTTGEYLINFIGASPYGDPELMVTFADYGNLKAFKH
jgi:hypothetical protein